MTYSINDETDLLNLELSHDDNSDDVSKPVQNTESSFVSFQNVSLMDDSTQKNIENNNINVSNTNTNNHSSSNSNSNSMSTNDQLTQKIIGMGVQMAAESMIENLSLNSGSNNNSQNLNDIQNGRNSSTTITGVSSLNAKCWQIEYYRPYFDVDTSLEIVRLKKALFPFISGKFFDEDLDEQPDLYGPFWAVSTLAFLMAAMGNLARFISREETNTQQWDGDIARMTEAATFLYTGLVVVPSVIYVVLRAYDVHAGLIRLVSLYGYSMVPFVPACIFCVLPWNAFDWFVVLAAMLSSILLLVKNIYIPLPEEKRSKPGIYLLAIIVLCQFALSLALKLYFFKY